MNKLINDIANYLISINVRPNQVSQTANQLFKIIRQSESGVVAKTNLAKWILENLETVLDESRVAYSTVMKDKLLNMVNNTPDSVYESAKTINKFQFKDFLNQNSTAIDNIVKIMQTEVANYLNELGLSITSGQKGALTRKIKNRIKASEFRTLDEARDAEFIFSNIAANLPDIVIREVNQYVNNGYGFDNYNEAIENFENRFTEETFSEFKTDLDNFINEKAAQFAESTNVDNVKAKYIDNELNNKLKTIRQKVLDLYNQASPYEQGQINLSVLLDNIRIQSSELYEDKIIFYYNKGVTSASANTGVDIGMGSGVIDKLLNNLIETVKENNSVFQIEIEKNVKTKLAEGGRHSNEIPEKGVFRVESQNKLGNIDVTKIYYPEENSAVLNKFTEWFDKRLELLSQDIEQINRLGTAVLPDDFNTSNNKLVNLINKDGPLFPNNSTAIKSYNSIILQQLRMHPELQYIIDTGIDHSLINQDNPNSPLRWDIVASNQESGNLNTIKEIHTQGYGQWYQDIININEDNITETLEKHPRWKKVQQFLKDNYKNQTLINNKFAILDDAPSWVYGLVHTGPDGKKRIISLALTDGTDNRFGNDLSYSVEEKTSNITTNFISWKPVSESGQQIVYGYYPNVLQNITTTNREGKEIVESINKMLKRGTTRLAQYWFGGMLAVADKDGVVCYCDPINGQVFDIYQRGGFIAENLNNLTIGEIPVNRTDLSTYMTRYPGPYIKFNVDDILDDSNAWSVTPLNGEFKIKKIRIETSVWGEPDDLEVTAQRKKFTSTQIQQSPRHMAILGLMEADLKKRYPNLDIQDATFKTAQAKLTHTILRLGGIDYRGMDINYINDAVDNNFVKDLKYIWTSNSDISNKFFNEILETLDHKILGEKIFNSSLLKDITGINTNEITDYLKKSVGISFNTDNQIDTGEIKKGNPDSLIIPNNANNVEIILDSLTENQRQEYGIYTPKEVLNSVNEGLEANEQVTELTQEFWKNWSNGTLAQTNLPHSTNTLGYFDNSVSSSAVSTANFLETNNFRNMYSNSPDNIIQIIRSAVINREVSPSDVVDKGGLVDANDWTGVDELVTSERSQISPTGRASDRQIKLQNTHMFERFYTGGNSFIERLSPRKQHRFTHILNELHKAENTLLLTADIEYVGSYTASVGTPIDYFEIGTVKQITREGRTELVKNYMTIAVDFTNMDTTGTTDTVAAKILSVQQAHKDMGSSGVVELADNNTFKAFVMMLNDSGLTTIGYRNPTVNTIETQIHPVGRVGKAMGVITRYDDGSLGINFDETTTNTNLKNTVDDIVDSSPNNVLMKDTIEQLLQDSQKKKTTTTDISPQPLYTNVNFDAYLNRADVYNPAIQELFDLIDNKTTGAVAISLRLRGTDLTDSELGTIVKRHGQQPTFNKVGPHLDSPSFDTDLIVLNKNNNIEVLGDLDNPNGAGAISNGNAVIYVDNIEIAAPSSDFDNRVIQNSLEKIKKKINANSDEFDNTNINSQLEGVTRSQNSVVTTTNGIIPLIGDDTDIEKVQAGYTLGDSIGYDGGTESVGVVFNPNRPPVGVNPDKKTLRQLGKAFAKTKTGKTLGYAWKTVDIGETLISKGFQKAAAAAAAAGAVSLGTGVAALATVWAAYEVGNLIVQAMRGIPDLYNVYEKRNEILANGEYWEKQLVEETFWKDYGSELLEILEDASKYSPAEILGDKIWSIALDSLFRQSQGESFPEIYEEDNSDLDMKNDIYYSSLPSNVKLEQMQNSIDYDKVLTGYYNNRPEANVIMNRTYELANNVYNRDGNV